VPIRTEIQQQQRAELEEKLSDIFSYIARGVKTYAGWSRLHQCEVVIQRIHWSNRDTFVVTYGDLGTRDVREDPMIVMNRAHTELHDLASTLEAWMNIKGCDASDIEVEKAGWSADSKLFIRLLNDAPL
jgi:hypothetical protein